MFLEKLGKIICAARIIDFLSLSKCSVHKHRMAVGVLSTSFNIIVVTIAITSYTYKSITKFLVPNETIESPSFRESRSCLILKRTMDFQFVQTEEVI